MLFCTFMCFVVNVVLVNGLGIYHVGSKITFHPDKGGEYFGFSIVISNGRVIVGAPKALSREPKPVASGLIFKCSLPKGAGSNNVTCKPMDLKMPTDGDTSYIINEEHEVEFYKEGMWLGASMETIPDGRILVCAPRYPKKYASPQLRLYSLKPKDMVLSSGFCYIGSDQSRNRKHLLAPMNDIKRVAFKQDKNRTEFYQIVYYYAYAEVGMSVAVTKNNTLVFGAPGTFMWAGSIAEYAILNGGYDFKKRVVLNPYDTNEIGPDDYFGYTVESANFEGNTRTTIYYVAGAPRSAMGNGQVYIFEPPKSEREPLNIHYAVKGPQLGSYFGASVRCPDLNGDGYPDLVVGAPNYVIKDGTLAYDHGAAFVYINKAEVPLKFNEPVMITGSGSVGARFGTSIADLGDIDGDGFNDIAIGAPYENAGRGAVYIYKGSKNGIRTKAVQRVVADNSLGFGIAIAKGYDFDSNQCNELVVGAFQSSSVYLHSCIPSLRIEADIKVEENIEWSKTSNNFTALFCITVHRSKWVSRTIDLNCKIEVDGKANRAQLLDEDEFTKQVTANSELCSEKVIEVKPNADLSKPIFLSFTLEPIYELKEDDKVFDSTATRVSNDSKLESKNSTQLISDCESGLICKPLLHLHLTSLNSLPYIPGTDEILGIRITVSNKGDPAFNAKARLLLPLPPKRVPESCRFNKLNLTCHLPSPLERDSQFSWDIKLEYVQTDDETKEVEVLAKVYDEFYSNDSFDKTYENVTLIIKPEIRMRFSGKTLPNNTILVLRHRLHEEVLFVHYYEILNYGPSDLKTLEFTVSLPDVVNIREPPKECTRINRTLRCITSVPAKVPRQVVFVLKIDLKEYGNLLEEFGDVNMTTIIENKYSKSVNITTRLVLEPASPVWPIVVGIVAGLVLLAPIVYVLYKLNFFTRNNKEMLKPLHEDTGAEDSSSNLSETPDVLDDSTMELIDRDDLYIATERIEDPVWPIVVGIVTGLLLAPIVYVLYKSQTTFILPAWKNWIDNTSDNLCRYVFSIILFLLKHPQSTKRFLRLGFSPSMG